MRLTSNEISSIKTAAKRHFGKAVRVWLFGSRTRDNARGGDIDLYIETDIEDPRSAIQARLHFLMELQEKIGEQKIDVVLHRIASQEHLAVYNIAKKTGILL